MIVNVNNGTNNKSKTSEFSYGATFQVSHQLDQRRKRKN